VRERGVAIAVDMLGQPDAGARLAQQACECRPPDVPCVAAQVGAVDFQQIERIEEAPMRPTAVRSRLKSVTPSSPQTTPSPSRVTDLTRSAASTSAMAGTRSV
jgi:hypothetical protein